MWGGILNIYRYMKVTSTFTETLAKVIETTHYGDTYTLTIQFVEKNTGNQITTTCSTINDLFANRGQVSILYDPTNPLNVELKATFDGNYLINYLIAMLPGVIIVIVTVFIIIAHIKRRAIKLKRN